MRVVLVALFLAMPAVPASTTTTDFRREPNDGKFSPVPCSAR
jgi:hypothetical protein